MNLNHKQKKALFSLIGVSAAFIFLFFNLFVTQPIAAQDRTVVTICGTLGDELPIVWTRDNVYNIDCDTTLDDISQLTIEAGTQISLTESEGGLNPIDFTIEGTLIVEGEVNDPVLFTTDDPFWSGIQANAGSSVTIRNAIFDKSGGVVNPLFDITNTVKIFSDQVLLDSITFRDTLNSPVWVGNQVGSFNFS
ncbi:MAG: hypothetical protein AAF633_06775, partial [Chloroflexota bacterium]